MATGRYFTVFSTAWGWAAVSWNGRKVSYIYLLHEDKRSIIAYMQKQFQKSKAPNWVQVLIGKIQAHLAGKMQCFRDIPLDFEGISSFRKQVYERLLKVKAGNVITYGEIAKDLGKPKAARAVGQALGKNRFPLIIPCHRVVTADKRLGGFSAWGGTKTKAKLLKIEGYQLQSC